MLPGKVGLKNLRMRYLDTDSLDFKKLQIVNDYIDRGHTLLDIGVGSGDLIKLVKNKFDTIYGIDVDEESIEICNKLFTDGEDIHITQNSMDSLDNFENDNFDYITCLDVLEHVDVQNCKENLGTIYELLKDEGKLVFSGPGVFEKIRISLGKSPTHLHSHSSYGWKKMIQKAGFDVLSIETVEFPIVHNNFLRKNMHLFGKCCVIVAIKLPHSELK